MSLGWFSKRPHFVPWMGKPCLCQYFNLLPCPYRCLCTWILLSQFQPTFVWYLMPVQGWGSGKQLPPMWFASKSWHQRHTWVEFVVGSLPCSERFLSGHSGFPLSLKTIHFQISIWPGQMYNHWMCYLKIFIFYLFHLSDPTFSRR